MLIKMITHKIASKPFQSHAISQANENKANDNTASLCMCMSERVYLCEWRDCLSTCFLTITWNTSKIYSFADQTASFFSLFNLHWNKMFINWNSDCRSIVNKKKPITPSQCGALGQFDTFVWFAGLLAFLFVCLLLQFFLFNLG